MEYDYVVLENHMKLLQCCLTVLYEYVTIYQVDIPKKKYSNTDINTM